MRDIIQFLMNKTNDSLAAEARVKQRNKKKSQEKKAANIRKELNIDEDVVIRFNSRAKRLILRPDIGGKCFYLTIPNRTPIRRIDEFLNAHRHWIDQKREKQAERIIFKDGVKFPYWGQQITVKHESTKIRALTRLDGDTLYVHGDKAAINGRVKRFVKDNAVAHLEKMGSEIIAGTRLKYKLLQVKDTKSRWGSCTSTREITLSWRLAFAPKDVAFYVLAHEIAHLKYMDHSAKFWDFCETLCVHTNESKYWLKKNGGTLHLYG